MNQLLSLGVVFISGLSIGSGEECCQRKQVGEHVYNFVRSEDTSGYGCTSGCAYTRDGAPESLYCFKSGMLESACQDDHCKSAADDKPKEINTGCTVDRDCSNPQYTPQKCVLDLKIETRSDIAVDGRPRTVLAYNGQIPGPPIVLCEGDELVVNFENRISGNLTNIDGSTNTTTLHFHGIREKSRPWSDGVPFVTQCPIQPGDPTFHYGFNASCVDGAPPGTYWYHSHVGSQRTNGAYGALVIKERVLEDSFVDDAANTLVLQEWYESSTTQVPVSLLINGKGRAGEYIHSGDNDTIDDYLKGKGGVFKTVPNIHYKENFITNYHTFPVHNDTSYRFRIIGAISQNFPLKLSIEDHTFTAIAVDSLPIQHVHGLTAVWLAAGERYDIVVKTKTTPRVDEAYKIRVSGYSRPRYLAGPLCTIAWLKYPEQSINKGYICNPDEHLPQPPTPRTLNPVPNNFSAWDSRLKYPDWNDTTKAGDIFIVDLRAPKPEPTIHFHNESNLNTHYIAFEGGIAFNGKKMTYPDIPFLLQDPANITERCGGSECMGGNCIEYTGCKGYSDDTNISNNNTLLTQFDCNCQHVIKEPWSPGNWAEFVLINNYNWAVAHPIHQHGGWYWVVGMGKYGLTGTNHISREFIINEDKRCPKKRQCLKRNFDNPPAKDTIQVPQNGYVIIRTKLDNPGTWIFHCHINHHVELGMAMVLQIGGLGEGYKNGLQGPWGKSQEWSTGPLKRNGRCKTKPNSIYGSLNTIEWFIGMKPARRCVAPGEDVSFLWRFGHNVNQITETEYKTCNIINGNQDVGYGGYVFTAPNTTVPKDYYFACGVGGGYHCKYYNMNAKITVSNKCN